MLDYLSRDVGRFPLGFAPKGPIAPEIVMRKKWEDNYPCLPKHCINKYVRVAMRSLSEITKLGENVPPRVSHAILRLFFHGWPTQNRCGILRHKCLLCASEQGDRTDHIMRCPVVRRCFAAYGICSFAAYRPEVFLLCHFQHSRGDNLRLSAIIATAVYNLLNKLRHGAKLASYVSSQLDKYIDDAISGHSEYCHSLVRSRRVNTRVAEPFLSVLRRRFPHTNLEDITLRDLASI